jgi:protease-4
MAYDLKPDPASGPRSEQRIVIQQLPPKGSLLGRRFLMLILGVSILANFWMLGKYNEYFIQTAELPEKFHSGETFADKKIAVIRAHGLIAEEASDYVVKQAKQAKEDDDVVAVVVEIDSPGGLVSDSHRIYHRLSELSSEKPVIISMKGLAASGGYYIAMAAGKNGKIFAEPTTWTGSIGVVIPHYDLSGLIGSWNVKDDSISSGPLKLMGSPTRPMNAEERKVLQALVDESYAGFKEIVASGRPKFKDDPQALDAAATGQIFTAKQAMERGLVDKFGFIEDAIERAAQLSGYSTAELRCVKYEEPATLASALMGAHAAASQPAVLDLATWLDLTAPRAYYLWTWLPTILSNTPSH